jgi:UDP-N-acetylmuramate dehydrogenase
LFPTLFQMPHSLIIQENVPLAPLTTFKIGGDARFLIRAETEIDIIEAFDFAKKNEFQLFILGGGSNVLISDNGFDGVVIQIAIKGVAFEQENDRTMLVTAGAGEDWDNFVELCVGRNLQGIECLSGIPGLVGGTPVQNVGAYGQEVSETILSVRCFDRKSKSFVELSSAECKFAYRQSIFNKTEKERFIVISVKYSLNAEREPKIVYGDLQKHFGERIPTLKETRDAVLSIRSAKSMVINETDPNSKSVGSFFKNPVVSVAEFEQIQAYATSRRASNLDGNIPFFQVDDKSRKIPAAWLIENSGFHKGFAIGNVGLSTKHTLAFTNLGTAKAVEVLNLMKVIQEKVNDQFGIQLFPEPVFIGMD